MTTYTSIDPKKPQNIALSFSGGGFRAASFSLGCLSFLEKLRFDDRPFMDMVKFASSASGGSITLLSYAASKRAGKETFNDYFRRMATDVLYGEILLNEVFTVMKDSPEWAARPDKSRNLINAFSIVYDRKIFKGDVFGSLWKNNERGIPAICANTTEFQNGMLFRFQNEGETGNSFIRVNKDEAATQCFRAIKLGDILACSSCFPVGFEPFVYPKDFSYEALSARSLETAVRMNNRYINSDDDEKQEGDATSKPESRPVDMKRNRAVTRDLFPLMDGGIDDNQGIDSFMLAEDRLEEANNFGYDLYMTCDVSSNYTDGYSYPSQLKANWFGRRSLLFYFLSDIVLLLLSITGAVFNVLTGLSYALTGIFSLLLLLMALVILKLRGTFNAAKLNHSTAVLMILKNYKFFIRLEVSILIQEIYSRLTSAVELAAVIFLKKIRRMSYGGLFQRSTTLGVPKGMADPNGPAVKNLKFWGRFALMNAVYLLSAKNKKQCDSDLKREPWTKTGLQIMVDGKPADPSLFLSPSDGMINVAGLATSMDTTLWYNENHRNKHQPEALLAAGNFTTCYNLLRWSLRFTDHPGETVWQDFQQLLIGHYTRFKDNPYWMYNEYVQGGIVLTALKTDDRGNTVSG